MFYPIKNEPDLRHLFNDVSKSINFALPVIQKNHQMNFFSWKIGEPLHTSQLGVPEPITNFSQPLFVNTSTLILVPALAIDMDGIRLGYGGGYYDRFLKNVETDHIMCVLWDSFVLDEKLPQSKWDIPIKLAATEAGIMDLG